MNINVFNSSSLARAPRKLLTNAVREVLTDYGRKEAEINVILLDDEEIHKLNKQYLDHDMPTDVITFSLGEETLEGEIYIGCQTAAEQARDYRVSMTDELTRLAIHGALHLLGFDDATQEERANMSELENKFLAKVR